MSPSINNPAYAVYLFRYLNGPLFLTAALFLLWRSLRALGNAFRRQSRPVRGYFLMGEHGHGLDEVQSFPLYHTSSLGKSGTADIRLSGRKIRRQHALIYLFNGRWYLNRSRSDASLSLNGEELTEEMKLENGDRLGFPGMELVFIDERKSAREAGVDFEATWSERRPEVARDSLLGSPFALIFGTAFFLLGILSLMLLLPSGLTGLWTLILMPCLAFLCLVLSAYFLWPKIFDHMDRGIFLAVSLLAELGLILQLRLSFLNRPMPTNGSFDEASWFRFLQLELIKQSLFPLAGMILMPFIILLVSRTRLLEKLAPLCLILTPLLYLATRIFGRDLASTGAGLWIPLPAGLSIQLTEFAKISYLIVLAWFFKIKARLRMQILFAAWAALVFLLIMWLPDLGSMMILLPVTLIVFSVMTSEYLKTFFILLGGAGIFSLAYEILPYVQRRIHGWLTLWEEVNPQNDQIISGLRAIARGGLFGSGLASSEPGAIPLASSDMIFSFVCEEYGLLVGLAVVILFMMIWLRAAYAVTLLRDGFSCSLILALATAFFVEAAVVIGGSTGLIPLTGATLPFIARGGSSMLAKWLVAAMLLGLWNRREEGAYRL